MGRGEKGAPLFIGIEHKKIPDLVQSLGSDRLAGHQLQGMLSTYDRPHLLIEGEWDHDDAGCVTQVSRLNVVSRLKGCPPAVVLEQRVLTLETRGGLHVRWTPNQKASVRYLTALYRFWTDKNLDQHKSHLAVHAADLDSVIHEPVSLKRQIASQLPGIGLERSKAIDQHFHSLWEMVNAPESEWAKVPGVGSALAKKLVKACREGVEL